LDEASEKKKKQALAYSLLQAVISTFTKTNVYNALSIQGL